MLQIGLDVPASLTCDSAMHPDCYLAEPLAAICDPPLPPQCDTAAAAGGHAREGVHDTHRRAEQTDERRRGTHRREFFDAGG